MINRSLLLTTAALALGLAACSPEKSVLNKPPGEYKSTTSSTNAAGTTTKTETNTDVDVDRYGRKSATVKSTTTKDPKGLFNKTTTRDVEAEIHE